MPKKFLLSDCGERGWFVGNWPNAAFQTSNVEVTGKFCPKGDTGRPHYHKLATEVTLVVTGLILVDGEEFKAGEIVVVEPNEVSNYVALEDSYIVGIKIPGEPNDKYYV